MKIPILIGMACLVAAPLALADNHATGNLNGPWVTGPIYGCSFKDVNGYEMSEKHAALVNAWGEEHGAFQNHVGQLMWPEFSDGQYPTEFTWLGYWENYADYGADMDKRAEHGADLYVEANKFLEQCSHSEWGAWELFPAEDWTLGNHVTEFSDCFYKEGKGDADLLVANIAFAKEMSARGSPAQILAQCNSGLAPERRPDLRMRSASSGSRGIRLLPSPTPTSRRHCVCLYLVVERRARSPPERTLWRHCGL